MAAVTRTQAKRSKDQETLAPRAATFWSVGLSFLLYPIPLYLLVLAEPSSRLSGWDTLYYLLSLAAGPAFSLALLAGIMGVLISSWRCRRLMLTSFQAPFTIAGVGHGSIFALLVLNKVFLRVDLAAIILDSWITLQRLLR